MPTIDAIVIGAGWAGLSAARLLTDNGFTVVVLEKSRGPGGRSATRRQDGFAFDHGAQYFTARSAEFRDQVEAWKERGLVADWEPRIRTFGERPSGLNDSPDQRLVAVPGMNAVLSQLADGLDCRFGQRVRALSFDRLWTLEIDGADPIGARHLVLTAPPAQALSLLGKKHPLTDTLASVTLRPTWALMVGYQQALSCDFDAAFDNEGPLSWLACNSSKPGRAGNAWVAHASAAWSEANLELSFDSAARKLFSAFVNRVESAGLSAPTLCLAHRWRYAQSPAPLQQQALVHEPQSLVVAGDWCAGNRIEGAWLSGQSAARTLLAF